MVSVSTLDGYGSIAPSHPEDDPSKLDGSHVSFGSTATHDSTWTEIPAKEAEVSG